MAAQTRSLVSFVHVASVERSVAFYADLGFKVKNTVVPEGQSAPVWAWLESENANLMVGSASGTVDAPQQAILFYLYFDDIEQTRAALVELGHSPDKIKASVLHARRRVQVGRPGRLCAHAGPDLSGMLMARALRHEAGARSTACT